MTKRATRQAGNLGVSKRDVGLVTPLGSLIGPLARFANLAEARGEEGAVRLFDRAIAKIEACRASRRSRHVRWKAVHGILRGEVAEAMRLLRSSGPLPDAMPEIVLGDESC